MKPLNETFNDAKTKFKTALVDVIVGVHEGWGKTFKDNVISTNFSFAEGLLHFYPKGKPGVGSCPLFWGDKLRRFYNYDRHTNSKGISCPFDSETKQSLYEVTISEITYTASPRVLSKPVSKSRIKLYTTDKDLIDSYEPKIQLTTVTKYVVRIGGLLHMLPVDFEPNYEPNSKILYSVVGGYKFATMDLTNMREGAIE